MWTDQELLLYHRLSGPSRRSIKHAPVVLWNLDAFWSDTLCFRIFVEPPGCCGDVSLLPFLASLMTILMFKTYSYSIYHHRSSSSSSDGIVFYSDIWVFLVSSMENSLSFGFFLDFSQFVDHFWGLFFHIGSRWKRLRYKEVVLRKLIKNNFKGTKNYVQNIFLGG